MPLTKLDANTALVVIDLQQGILAFPMAHSSAAVVAQASRLARAFRANDLPVALVNVTAGHPPGRTDAGPMRFTPPANWLELAPELEPRDSDIRITKQQWGGFHGTALDLELRRRGVTQVVLCGIATSIGVESTARDAYERSYHVTLVLDAMTDLTATAHDNSTALVVPRLGETGTTNGVLALLEAR